MEHEWQERHVPQAAAACMSRVCVCVQLEQLKPRLSKFTHTCHSNGKEQAAVDCVYREGLGCVCGCCGADVCGVCWRGRHDWQEGRGSVAICIKLSFYLNGMCVSLGSTLVRGVRPAHTHVP